MKRLFIALYKRFLRWCARRVIVRTRPYVIGVTGSVGKTTARLLIAQTVQQCLPTVSVLTSPKNFNGDMGFALSVLGIESFSPSVGGYRKGAIQAMRSAMFSHKVDVMVLEYGIDSPGEMDLLLAIAKPHVGVITTIDAVHSLQMGDPTQIAEQKRKMIDAATDLVLLNRDDEYVQQMADRTQADVMWYSIQDGATGDVGYRQMKLVTDEQTVVASEVELFAGKHEWTGRVSVVSRPLVSYAAIGMAVVDVLAYRLEQNVEECENLSYVLQPGRLSFYRGQADSVIIDSSYNAAPRSMEAMLGVAYRIKHDVYRDNRPLIGIIGEMRELGDLSEQSHRRLAGTLSQGLDYIVLVGQDTHYTMDELTKIGYPKNQVRHFVSSRAAGQRVRDLLTQEHDAQNGWHDALIFVKGSQNTIYLEEAIKELLLDPADAATLGRQEGWWMEKKERFFGE